MFSSILFFLRGAGSLTAPKAWSQSPRSVKELRRLKSLVGFFWNPDLPDVLMNRPGQYYGGGPLTKSVGDYLSKEKVQLTCLYARYAVKRLAKPVSD